MLEADGWRLRVNPKLIRLALYFCHYRISLGRAHRSESHFSLFLEATKSSK